ncbi:MAG: DUF4350 domain-containing protein [Verrucomicrobiae bacterium]|nr:DUF4350 domain-containing protein [Verrucomicrobiae bacterium]
MALFAAKIGVAQQVPYLGYNPPIHRPAYSEGKGPVIGVDEAHNNYHTATGRYAAFANLLRRDGYRIERVKKDFTAKGLTGLDILVISNPLHSSNNGNWTLPTPSAFTNEEIAAVKHWVSEGGSLLLIADHMPFPGAAGELAESFGFTFSNGFAYLGNDAPGQPDYWSRGLGLADCVIANGRNKSEAVQQVVSFTGSAFQAPEGAIPVLVFPPKSISKVTPVAWQFDEKTVEVPIDGWLQGSIMQVGKGRIAVWGEAAMFTAQLSGRDKRPMGMAALYAQENFQLLLNLMHWLSDLEGMPD